MNKQIKKRKKTEEEKIKEFIKKEEIDNIKNIIFAIILGITVTTTFIKIVKLEFGISYAIGLLNIGIVSILSEIRINKEILKLISLNMKTKKTKKKKNDNKDI